MQAWGVDVDSRALVIAQAGQVQVQTIANTEAAIAAWLRGQPGPARLGLEATSRYHEALANAAHAAGWCVYVLHPRDVRHYARGLGCRGKTDRVDARVIARYVAKEHDRLHPYQPPSAAQQALQRCQQERAALVKAQMQLRQALGHAAAYAPLMQQLRTAIAAADRRLRACVQAEAAWRALFQRLQTVPGIGPVVAACVVYHLSQRAYAHCEAWIASTGLDPRPQQSGKAIGRRRLSKRGPGSLRRMLYLAAMTFARHPLGQALYARYRQRMSATAAYNVLARLLARLAWHLQQTNSHFDPDRFRRDHSAMA